MSDFFKKLKGVFVIEDPNQPAISQPQQSNTPSTVSKEAAQSSSTTPFPKESGTVQTPYKPSVSSGQGQVNEKFTDALFKAMEVANVEGFDYFEFKQALNNLASMPMDEATRYKSAYAMAQTMGATPAKLVSTASSYLDALKQEEAKFQQAANNQVQSQIGNKQSQISNFDAVIKQKSEQIKKMVEEIEQHKKEMESLKQDIAQASSKVAQTKADFDATYQSLVGQIQKDIDNMNNYLK